MAIALVSSVASVTDQNGTTTGGIDTTGANLLVVHVARYQGGPSGTLSDSKSNTWTPLTVRGAGDPTSRIFYCESPNVGSGHTFTWSQASSYPSIQVMAFSGANLTAAYESENGSSASSVTSLQPGSVTPSENGSLIIAGLTLDGSITGLSANSSFTIEDENAYGGGVNMGGAAAYLIQGAAGAINPTWSWTTSRTVASSIAVFLAEPGGGGGTILPIVNSIMLGGVI